MNLEWTKNDGTFSKVILLGVAYCALTIAIILTMMIWPLTELNLILKFLIFFGLTFALLTTLINIKASLNYRNREILISEIRTLLK